MNLALVLFISLISLSVAVKINLKVYPQPDDPKSRLIWINHSTTDVWSQKLDNYLEVYRTHLINREVHDNMLDCDYEHPSTEDKACTVNTETFNPCVVTNYFGYKNQKPCVFIELQKVEGWQPMYYNDSKSLPTIMPSYLQNHIDLATQDPNEWESVWISCEGDTAADKEFIGPVKYYPQPGYPGYMFPYLGQKNYLNPTVAVQFDPTSSGVVINIVCKLWSPGITLNQKDSNGVATFQLLMD